ncbi:MAG: FAD:protein FMN transferase [Oceanococcus sp.]
MLTLHIHRFHALGGPCTLQFYAAAASANATALAAENEVLRIQAKYSRYTHDSVLSRINSAAGSGQIIKIDEETQALLRYAAVAYRESDGLFDISSGVLRRAWDFKSKRPPSQSALDALLPLIDWTLVQWSGEDITLPKSGMEIDFGGFGKEYAADRTAAVLRQQGIQHGLVDLSGDIHVIGPHPDGQPWTIGIQHPRQNGAITRLTVQQGAIASSGDYERGFVHRGRRYSHILNPKTGWPVLGLASVSTIADNCLIAGTASTCAMLRTPSKGLSWLKQLGLPFLAIDQQLRLFDASGRIKKP